MELFQCLFDDTPGSAAACVPLQFWGLWPFYLFFFCWIIYTYMHRLNPKNGYGCLTYYKAYQNSDDCVVGYTYALPFSDTTWNYSKTEDIAFQISFYSSLWPGFDFTLFFLLFLFRRGCLEFFVLLGLSLQGLAPELSKHLPSCLSTSLLENDPMCQVWKRPAESCLDDCGMPSGHVFVACFYLGWGIPYVLKWHAYRRRVAGQGECAPLLAGAGHATRQANIDGLVWGLSCGPLVYIPRKLREFQMSQKTADFVHVFLCIFFSLQAPFIWIVGDHTWFQIFVAVAFGLLEGWIYERYIVTMERVRGFCDTPLGKYLGFYDNYTFGLDDQSLDGYTSVLFST